MPDKPAIGGLILLLAFPSLMLAGTITGKVTYTGTPPKPRAIDMSSEPACAKQHSTPLTGEGVVTGPNNALQNVVVFISAGAPDESQVPAQAATMEQKGCQYIPHIVVMHTGQQFKVLNSDSATHNVHPEPRLNPQWNRSQNPGAPPLMGKYDKEEFIPVKCNVHPWMLGYFVVLKTSHYDVTRNDGGFKLPDVPPGKYTLTAWQERFGTRTADVTITGNETRTVNFTFDLKP